MNNFDNIIKKALTEGIQPADKVGMKTRLLSEIHYKDPFYRKIHAVVQNVRPSVNMRVLTKEKLLAAFDLEKRSWFEIPAVRRFASVATLAAFMFMVVFQPFATTNVVRANDGTRIVGFSGVVTVQRNGELFNAVKDFPLNEGDVIQTGPAGFAEVVFADDSVSRLGGDTRVVMSGLDEDELEFNANVTVLAGEVWSNVLGGDDDYNFRFNAENLSGTVQTSAVFDVEVMDGFVRIVTLDNSVKLLLNNDGDVVPAVLRKGQLVKVKKETPVASYLAQQSLEDKLADLNLDWYEANFKQDSFYYAQLRDKKFLHRSEEAGITPDSLFYPMKEFRRAARLAVTFDPIKQSQMELVIANQKLLEAEVLLSKGDKETARKLLKEYEESLGKVATTVSSLKQEANPETDQKVADLNKALSVSLVVQKKSFKEVLPTADNYEAKVAVNNAQLLVAGNAADRQKVEIAQADDALFEAKLLFKENQPKLAEERIQSYVDAIAKVQENIGELPVEDQTGVASKLLESNANGVVALDSVKQDVVQQQTLTVQDEVEGDEVTEVKVEELPVADAVSLEKTLTQAQTKSVQSITDVINSVNASAADPNLLKQATSVSELISQPVTTLNGSNIIIQTLPIPAPAVTTQTQTVLDSAVVNAGLKR